MRGFGFINNKINTLELIEEKIYFLVDQLYYKIVFSEFGIYIFLGIHSVNVCYNTKVQKVKYLLPSQLVLPVD